MKELIVIVGPNGAGKSAAARALLSRCPRSAYVDGDWCRAINPFPFTEETKRAVTDNIFCFLKNYLLCRDIDRVVFSYGFHGERKGIFDQVKERLEREKVPFKPRIVVLTCSLDENIRRAKKDGRDEERIKRGITNTFHFYDSMTAPVIDTTGLEPGQVAQRILEIVTD